MRAGRHAIGAVFAHLRASGRGARVAYDPGTQSGRQDVDRTGWSCGAAPDDSSATRHVGMDRGKAAAMSRPDAGDSKGASMHVRSLALFAALLAAGCSQT